MPRSHPRAGAPIAAPESFVSVSLPVAVPRPPARVFHEAPPAPPVVRVDRTALLIGINHATGHTPLEGAVHDAEMLQQALHGYGFPDGNVVTLTEGAATARRILAELDSLAARSAPGGRAVFAFAGHTRLVEGVANFVAADGGLIPAGTIATKLARVQAPMWVVLPTCYAGAYNLPGIVGPGRVATFASSANSESYELGPNGSWLVLYMVEYGMIDGRAPHSVETAFAYAKAAIDQVTPAREPFMVDDFPGGDFVLGGFVPTSGGGQVQGSPPPGDGMSGYTPPGDSPSSSDGSSGANASGSGSPDSSQSSDSSGSPSGP